VDINLILLKFYDIKEFNKHIRLHALFGLVIFFFCDHNVFGVYFMMVSTCAFSSLVFALVSIPLEDVLASSHPWTLISSKQ